MALATYSDLKTSVANYLARSDLTSQIPDFIQLAEIRLRRDLRIRQMLKVATTTTTGGDSTVGLPSDFLELRDIFFISDPSIVVSYLTPSSFTRNARATESGKPVNYTILSGEFQFAPIPDTTYTIQMLYYAAPTFLSDAVSSNVFLVNAPDALLYGALGEAEPYLMNDARLQTWNALYQRAIVALGTADEQGEFSASPLKMTLASR
jgi:hypothetical protein